MVFFNFVNIYSRYFYAQKRQRMTNCSNKKAFNDVFGELRKDISVSQLVVLKFEKKH